MLKTVLSACSYRGQGGEAISAALEALDGALKRVSLYKPLMAF
jgi:hypothetical protein